MSGPAEAWPRPLRRGPGAQPCTARLLTKPSRNMLLHLTAPILVDREKAEASGFHGYTPLRRCADFNFGDARGSREVQRASREAKLRRRACPGPLSLPSRRSLASSELLQCKAQWIVMPYTRV